MLDFAPLTFTSEDYGEKGLTSSAAPSLASGKPGLAREGISNKLWVIVRPSKAAI